MDKNWGKVTYEGQVNQYVQQIIELSFPHYVPFVE